VQEGYVSADAAHKEYGVVVLQDGSLDPEATEILRSELRKDPLAGEQFEVIAG
jgi:hypothetical protein